MGEIMDTFFIAIAVLSVLVGAAGLYSATRGQAVATNPVTRMLFSVHGHVQSRTFVALSSAAIIVFGAYLLLSSVQTVLPLWPSLVALVAFGALQISARLQRHDV